MTVIILLIVGAGLVCMFVLADDIADMREELSLLNKRAAEKAWKQVNDNLAHGDIPTIPTDLSRGE